MRARIVTGVCLLFPLCTAHAQRASSPPDLILVGGKVFTADSLRPWAEAVAIKGDRIIAVGTSAEITGLARRSTRHIALGGRTVVPGFNDAHAHAGAPLPGIAFRTSNDPVPDPPLATVLDSLSVLVRRFPEGMWLRTDIDVAMLDDPRARRTVLDSVAPRHPVWLNANTGHGIILNTAGLRTLGIRDNTPDPAGGFYEREGVPYPGRGQGRITGLLHEYSGWNASQRLRSAQPDSVLVAAMRAYGEQALQLGITTVQNVAITYDAPTTLRVQRLARLALRVRIVPMPATGSTGRLADEWRKAVTIARTQPWGSAPHPTISGVKWILDGTGIERLSVLRASYSDRPGWFGQLNFPPDTLRAMLQETLASGEQPVLHAIGDSTIAVVLSTMESLAQDSVWRRLRPRLEHAEWLTSDLRRRAIRLGVVVVQNPTHFTDPPELVLARFGEHRARDYQPFASLVKAGIPLAIGSDGPMNPFLNLLFAVTHPVNPAEALSLEQAVIAYTRGSAYAEHMEREKGMLAPGMLADLAVMSQDIFTVSTDELPNTTSLLTIVGGTVVHDRLIQTARSRSGQRSRAGFKSSPGRPIRR